MFWMILVMTFPVLGLALFLFLPLWIALPMYLAVLVISVSCHWLMMRSMRFPVQVGRRAMIGSTALVLNWEGSRGQINWNGEIWQAEAPAETKVWRGESVTIHGLSGLTVLVKPVEPRNPEGSAVKTRQDKPQ